MIGFAENSDGNVCAVLVQPYIDDARLATREEIHEEFLKHIGACHPGFAQRKERFFNE